MSMPADHGPADGLLHPLAREVGKVAYGPHREVPAGVDYDSLFQSRELHGLESLLQPSRFGTGPGGCNAPGRGAETSVVARPYLLGSSLRLLVAAIRPRRERLNEERTFLICRYLCFTEVGRVGPAHVQRHLERMQLVAWREEEVVGLSHASYDIPAALPAHPVLAPAFLQAALAWLYSGVGVYIDESEASRDAFWPHAQRLLEAVPALDRPRLSWGHRCHADVDRRLAIAGGVEPRDWMAIWSPKRQAWRPPQAAPWWRIDRAVPTSAPLASPLTHSQALSERALQGNLDALLRLEQQDARRLPSSRDGFLDDGLAVLDQVARAFADIQLAEGLQSWLKGALPAAPLPRAPTYCDDAVALAARDLSERARTAELSGQCLPAVEVLFWSLIQGPSGALYLHSLARVPAEHHSLRLDFVAALWVGEGVLETVEKLRRGGYPTLLPTVEGARDAWQEALELSLVEALEHRANVRDPSRSGNWDAPEQRRLAQTVNSLASGLASNEVGEISSVLLGPSMPAFLALLACSAPDQDIWDALRDHLPGRDNPFAAALEAVEAGRDLSPLVRGLGPNEQLTLQLRILDHLGRLDRHMVTGEDGQPMDRRDGWLASLLALGRPPPHLQVNWPILAELLEWDLRRGPQDANSHHNLDFWKSTIGPGTTRLDRLLTAITGEMPPESTYTPLAEVVFYYPGKLFYEFSQTAHWASPRRVMRQSIAPIVARWPRCYANALGHMEGVDDPELLARYDRLDGVWDLPLLQPALAGWRQRPKELHQESALWLWRRLGQLSSRSNESLQTDWFVSTLGALSRGAQLTQKSQTSYDWAEVRAFLERLMPMEGLADLLARSLPRGSSEYGRNMAHILFPDDRRFRPREVTPPHVVDPDRQPWKVSEWLLLGSLALVVVILFGILINLGAQVVFEQPVLAPHLEGHPNSEAAPAPQGENPHLDAPKISQPPYSSERSSGTEVEP